MSELGTANGRVHYSLWYTMVVRCYLSSSSIVSSSSSIEEVVAVVV